MIQVEVDRRIAEGVLPQAIELIQALRNEAAKHQGFIDGYLLQRMDDCHRIESTATWQSLRDWEAWEHCEIRHNINVKIAPMLEEPEVTRLSILLQQVVK